VNKPRRANVGWVALLVPLAFACRDPQLDPLRDALSAWEEGKRLLEAGDHSGATTAFESAVRLDPSSPSLVIWLSRARFAGADAAGALECLSDHLRSNPRSVAALRERASLLARSGELARAASDLQLLRELGAADPWELAQDADLAALIDNPNWPGLVVAPQVTSFLRTQSDSLLPGDTWLLELAVEAPPGGGSLGLDGSQGLVVESIVENVATATPWRTLRLFEIRSRATVPRARSAIKAKVDLGGVQGTSNELSLEAMSLTSLAPSALPAELATFPLPSSVDPAWPPLQAHRSGAWVLVPVLPGQQLLSEPIGQPKVWLELRQGGQIIRGAWAFRAGGLVGVNWTKGGQTRPISLPGAVEPQLAD
jgi:hypothetical protein